MKICIYGALSEEILCVKNCITRPSLGFSKQAD